MHILDLGLPIATLAAAGEGAFNPLDQEAGGNFLWTWIIFLLALPVIWKLVMGPITRALEERDDRVNTTISAAERASQEAERARAEVEVRLGEAQTGAAKLLSEARERGEEREREILETARREAEALLTRARTEINAAREQALMAIRDEVVDLSMQAAGRVLERQVDSADDRRLVESYVALSKAASAKGGLA
jgi:F-type H+-transporting ATPase subunit b